jgi:hypothetical protein
MRPDDRTALYEWLDERLRDLEASGILAAGIREKVMGFLFGAWKPGAA